MTFSEGTTPLYYQVYLDFRAKIISGDWPSGTQVPTVDQLYMDCGVSRATIRKAMELLERDGFIFRKRGMGTFVRNLNLKATLHSLEEVTRYVDQTLETEIIKSEFVNPPVRVQNAFYPQKIDQVLHIQRLQKKDGIAYFYSNIFVTPDVGKKMNAADLKKMNVPQVIMSRLGIKMSKIFRIIRPWIADYETSLNLGVSLGTPIFKFDFTGYDDKGNVLYLTEMTNRIDGLILEVRIENQ